MFNLPLTKRELEEVISSLEGQIDCLSMLVKAPYKGRQLQEKIESLDTAKAVLERAEALLKGDTDGTDVLHPASAGAVGGGDAGAANGVGSNGGLETGQ